MPDNFRLLIGAVLLLLPFAGAIAVAVRLLGWKGAGGVLLITAATFASLTFGSVLLFQ